VRLTGDVPYAKRTKGLYLNTGKTYRGKPRFERRDYKGRRWSLYHRKRGMWVLDFNRVSQRWSGTVAYSEWQPERTVTTVDWLDFPGFVVEPVSASELSQTQTAEALRAYGDGGHMLETDEDEDEDEDEDIDDEVTAEDGELVTIVMSAKMSAKMANADQSDDEAHGAPDAMTKEGGGTNAALSTPVLYAVTAISAAAILVTLGGLWWACRRHSNAPKMGRCWMRKGSAPNTVKGVEVVARDAEADKSAPVTTV